MPNAIERLFGRITRVRRVFTRSVETDVMFRAFMTAVFVADGLR